MDPLVSTDDAKQLYDLVAVGTPVLISSANFETDAFHEQTQSPQIDAKSYLAADLKSNFVFAEKDPNLQVPIASITKLMTALVAVEYINIEKKITVTPDMLVKTSDATTTASSISRPYMLVILGSTDYVRDAHALLNWIKLNYQ